ncbi:MAG: hypothetical protein GKS03_07950 [Alphaproteobacteria bacterium]|nr:hypothetical protein [Alphaproteobacteria bacterium]
MSNQPAGIVSAIAALFLLSSTVFAQSPSGMSATAFAEIPPNAILEIRAGRDLPLERDLVNEVGTLLSARGYTVAPRGEVVVTIDSTTPLPGIGSRSAITVDQRLRSMNTLRNDKGVTVPFNRKDAAPGAAVFTLRMSAYRPGQSNLWVGQASGPDNGSGRRATTFTLAKSLIAIFGQSTPDSAAQEPATD